MYNSHSTAKQDEIPDSQEDTNAPLSQTEAAIPDSLDEVNISPSVKAANADLPGGMTMPLSRTETAIPDSIHSDQVLLGKFASWSTIIVLCSQKHSQIFGAACSSPYIVFILQFRRMDSWYASM